MQIIETKTEKYPPWCKDEIDKLIHEILLISPLTKSTLVKKVYESLFTKLAGHSIDERLENLISLNALKKSKKQVDITFLQTS